MLTISYHDGDSFSNTDGNARLTYYNLSGDPTTWADGMLNQVGSYANVHQDSVAFAGFYNTRRAVTSPCSITVTGKYNTSIRSGQVKVTVTNTGASTITNHKLRYVIVETVPFNWQWTDTCWEVCRKMLPNSSGVTISLNAGQTVADSQSFAINPAWAYDKIRIAVFVQNDANKQILQGGWALLSSFSGAEIQETSMPKESGLELAQNRPNPSRGVTEIAFALPKAEEVRLAVYEPQGRLVQTLVDGIRSAGSHSVSITGLKSGVYFYRLEAGNTSLTRRMVVVK